jgi:hypothetical protein
MQHRLYFIRNQIVSKYNTLIVHMLKRIADIKTTLHKLYKSLNYMLQKQE